LVFQFLPQGAIADQDELDIGHARMDLGGDAENPDWFL